MKKLFTIFIVFSLVACKWKKADFNYLNSFTKEAYDLDLANQEVRLFFIDAQCIPCININKIKPFIENRNYVIITEDPLVKKLYPDLNILFSKKKTMHLLKENEYSNTIRDVKDNEVVYFRNHIQIIDSI